MMRQLWSLKSACNAALALVLATAGSAAAIEIKVGPMAKDLKNPESVAIHPDGRYFVSVIGEFDKDGDGSIVVVGPGKPVETIATGLDDPKGIAFYQDWLYVADKKKVVRVDRKGVVETFSPASEFPREPKFLNDIEIDAKGNIYVSDSGDLKGNDSAVFCIAPDRSITMVLDGQKNKNIKTLNGLLLDGPDHLLVADFAAGELHRMNIADGSLKKLADGMPGADGLVRDFDGNVYISQWLTGDVRVLPRGASTPILVRDKFQSAADMAINTKTGHLIVPDMKAGTVSLVPIRSGVPTDVDTSPLDSVKIVPAFQSLEVERPIVLTHGNDGSGRIFVASQLGKVFVVPGNKPGVEGKLFFDLESKVQFKKNENEEGFLGMAFHPKFKENGEFFVYYTARDRNRTSVISRFKANKDHTSADPATEEVLMTIRQPFWNHNGGTIVFGPDGYLYIALGDGGAGGDPYRMGQDLETWLGSILRIDVDHKDQGKNYAVPKDNPFVKTKGAQPEIYAYGVRNIWRMSFDKKTGQGWVADVGQDIWEEINLLVPGGNYGWNKREGMHPFRADGSLPKSEYLEPIWEYHHDIGKSITGGNVYRGQAVPELEGLYVYADYVTGKVWALKYDFDKKKVLANRSIEGNVLPVMSFGEDQDGELYYLTDSGRMYTFASAKK